MQFVYPQVLWALLALAIPIIIHLFHFRRFKKVYFTNIKFLKEIKEEKSTTRQLRNLLVLLMRLLAFTFLIFAFAQPFISKNNTTKTGKNYVSIFIDNSNSMMASSEDIPLLDKAKKKAEEIISAYEETDQFQIISHELKGSQQRWIDKENVLQSIENVELNPEVNVLSNVYSKQKQSAKSDGNHIIYILSDFQKSIADLPNQIDTSSEINLIPLQSIRENNLSIDSVWFESVVPSINQNNKLLVRIKNHGEERVDDIRLSINHNNQNRPEGTFSINARSSKIDTINLLVTEPGWQDIEIKIDDYPIVFDNSYFVSFNIKEALKVLSIYDNTPDRYLSALFQGLNSFELETMPSSAIQYDQFQDFDLIVLNDLRELSTGLSAALKNYVDNGGNAIVFPSERANIAAYNSFLSSMNTNTIQNWDENELAVFKINTAEFVFENVFTNTNNNLKLPITKGRYIFNNFSARAGSSILQYRDGAHFISKYGRNKGNLFVCSAPLDVDYNDFVLNAEVFVPFLYKAAYSASGNEKIAFTIGKDNFTEIKNTSNAEEIIYKIKGVEEFIPGQTNLGASTQINFNNMIKEAGFYNLELAEQLEKKLAFNYDRIESNLDYYSTQELKENWGAGYNIIENSLQSDLSNVIKEKDQGTTYWRWCLILALLFLAIETLLLRIWKT